MPTGPNTNIIKSKLKWLSSALLRRVEAASTSETSVNFYQTKLRNNLEDSQPSSYSPKWEPEISPKVN
jgi:hypothetical protein